MPAYNCEKFIETAINSIIKQSYSKWEAIIVDDCSTDSTASIIMNYTHKDKRIKFSKLNTNSGAAAARNKGIKMAKGEFIAFLDSDDYWMERKLDKQIKFMRNENACFSCTDYAKIDEKGNFLNKVIKAKKQSDYEQLLKKCPGNSTVIYNAMNLGKYYVPDIRKRNDYLMWLQVIKKAKLLYGHPETLSVHRIREGSISKEKFSLIKYHWKIYREFEKLTYVKSLNLVSYWILKTMVSRLHLFDSLSSILFK